MKAAIPIPDGGERRRRGRPTKKQTLELTAHIIDIATPLFLEAGYEATSIDSIVAAALISKQTFYARFESKEALFAAVIKRRMNDLIAPIARGPLKTGAIEPILVQISVELTKRALTPMAVAIDRLITAEARQFPQLAAVYRENSEHVRDLIAGVFERAMKNGEIDNADAHFLAEQFQFSVIDGPSRVLRFDQKAAKSEKLWRARVIAAVDLFLHGCSARAGS